METGEGQEGGRKGDRDGGEREERDGGRRQGMRRKMGRW